MRHNKLRQMLMSTSKWSIYVGRLMCKEGRHMEREVDHMIARG